MAASTSWPRSKTRRSVISTACRSKLPKPRPSPRRESARPVLRAPTSTTFPRLPAAQTVLDEWATWNFDFHRIVADAGYIVVSFDNRGTPAPKGRAWRKLIYGAIHPVIVKDQTAALKVFLQSHPYADPSRVALWG